MCSAKSCVRQVNKDPGTGQGAATPSSAFHIVEIGMDFHYAAGQRKRHPQIQKYYMPHIGHSSPEILVFCHGWANRCVWLTTGRKINRIDILYITLGNTIITWKDTY